MNKHGLSRTIPENVKLKIRQDAKFGCVICGLGIFEYEHIDPEYSDAKEHDPDKMTILCPSCHAKVTRGFWSKDKVWQAKANPVALSQGFANEWFDFGPTMPLIKFGGATIEECRIPILIANKPLFEIKPPIAEKTPFLLSGTFYGENGYKMLEIIDNEWRVYNHNWDLSVLGPVMKITDHAKNVVLQIRALPSSGIAIEKVNMFVNGRHVVADVDLLTIYNPNGSFEDYTNTISSHCIIGLSIN